MERIAHNGVDVIGFGAPRDATPPVRSPSPWAVAIATSVVGAAAGWVIEEVARKVRGKQR